MEPHIPETLAHLTIPQILQSIAKFKQNNKNKTFTNPKSMFGRAVTFLLQRDSTLIERKYFYSVSLLNKQVRIFPILYMLVNY